LGTQTGSQHEQNFAAGAKEKVTTEKITGDFQVPVYFSPISLYNSVNSRMKKTLFSGIVGGHKIIALIHGAAKFNAMVLFHRIIPGEIVIFMNDRWREFF
jgi:hypothetical protein